MVLMLFVVYSIILFVIGCLVYKLCVIVIYLVLYMIEYSLKNSFVFFFLN